RGSVTVSGHVLVVDDDRDMCRLVAAGLGQRGFEVTWRTSASEALEVVDGVDGDAVVTDLEMAGTNGMGLCEPIPGTRPDVPVAVLTGFGNFDAAVAAIRAGAYDFITKPPELDALAAAMARAVQHRALRADLKRLPGTVDRRGVPGLLTGSPKMQRVLDL